MTSPVKKIVSLEFLRKKKHGSNKRINKPTSSSAFPIVDRVVKVDSPLKSRNLIHESEPKVGLGGIDIPENCTFSNIIIQARPAVPQFLSNPTTAPSHLSSFTLIGLMFGLSMYILDPDMIIPRLAASSHDEIDLLVDSRERGLRQISYPKIMEFPFANIRSFPFHNIQQIVIPKIPQTIVIPGNLYNLASLFPNSELDLPNNCLLEYPKKNDNIHQQYIPREVVSLEPEREVVSLSQARDVVSLQRDINQNESVQTVLKERATFQPSLTTVLLMATTVALVITVMLISDCCTENTPDIDGLFPT